MSDTNDVEAKTTSELSRPILAVPMGPLQADPLVNLNTRIPASVKALLQAQADARNVALGVIITEHVTGRAVLDALARLEATVAMLAMRVEGTTPPPEPPSPKKSYDYMNIQVDCPSPPIREVLAPERTIRRPRLGQRILAWLFEVRS